MDRGNFFSELKRRSVYKVAIAYAAVAWLLIQLASILFPTFEAPSWVMKVFVAVVALGFPLALILAWAFELTPEGIKRTEDLPPNEPIRHRSGRKMMAGVAVVALLAAGLFTYQFFRARAAPPPEKSLAVLPFSNLSKDEENAFFADGVQDEILTRISKIADLKVISRTSTQKYRGERDSLRVIAQELGVTNVLEGSVQRFSDRVRITVQLINAVSDAHLWAETYDRQLTDIFAVQSDVAQKIASALQARLTGSEKNAIAQIGSTNPEASDAYLHALALRGAQSSAETERLLQYCRRAVELDPNFAQAWALLAGSEANKYLLDGSNEQLARARHAAETAVKLQPDLGESRTAMGSFKYYCLQDFDGALHEFEEARARLPNDGYVLLSIGLVKRRQGKLDESIEVLRAAARVDPRNTDVWINLGRTYRGARKFPAAHEMFDRALDILPGDRTILANKAEAFGAAGDLESADRVSENLEWPIQETGYGQQIERMICRREFDRALEKITADYARQKDSLPPIFHGIIPGALGELKIMSGDMANAQPLLLEAEAVLQNLREAGHKSWFLYYRLLHALALLGKRAELDELAAATLQIRAKDAWQAPNSDVAVAEAYALLGDANTAIPLIERALKVPAQESITTADLRLDPVWDRIRSDARFQQLAADGG